MRVHASVLVTCAAASGLSCSGRSSNPETEGCRIPATSILDVNLASETYATVAGRELAVDIAWPREPGRHPLVVMLHSGGWAEGERGSVLDEIVTLAGLGYAGAAPSYRPARAPKDVFPAALEDVRCALSWLRANAGRYRIDPARVAVAGHSAGGHLASLVGVAGGPVDGDLSCAAREGDRPRGADRRAGSSGQAHLTSRPNNATAPLRAVISFAGPQDLRSSSRLGPELADLVENFLGAKPEADPARAALASPVTHVDASDPPFLLIHRRGDRVVPLDQSRAMKRALDVGGVPATLVELPLPGHFIPAFSSKPRFHVATCATLRFLDRTLPSEHPALTSHATGPKRPRRAPRPRRTPRGRRTPGGDSSTGPRRRVERALRLGRNAILPALAAAAVLASCAGEPVPRTIGRGTDRTADTRDGSGGPQDTAPRSSRETSPDTTPAASPAGPRSSRELPGARLTPEIEAGYEGLPPPSDTIAPLAPPGAPASAFPKPDRPVARIVTDTWSDERTRDDAGEAARVMSLLGVTEGMVVADIGAGSGYYTVRLARRVGPSGQVVAEDIVPRYLERLRDRVRREGLSNVILTLGEPHDPRLPPRSIDLALMVHMYHEVEQPYGLLYNLATAVRPGARVGIVDLNRRTSRHGTPPRLLRCELAAVGYDQVGVHELGRASGYLAVFEAPTVPAEITPPDSIRACAA